MRLYQLELSDGTTIQVEARNAAVALVVGEHKLPANTHITGVYYVGNLDAMFVEACHVAYSELG